MGLPLILAGVSAATSLAGGVISGMGQEEAANYQAQVARNNAEVAQRNATIASQAGQAQAAIQGEKTAQTVGKTRAALGAAGVDTVSGSAADAEASQEAAGMTDAATIESNAERQAWGYQTQAVSDTAQAQLDVQQGKYGMLSSVLSGASSAAGSFAKYGPALFGSGNAGSGVAGTQ